MNRLSFHCTLDRIENGDSWHEEWDGTTKILNAESYPCEIHICARQTGYHTVVGRYIATAAIIKRKPIFVCLEDLNVQGMMKNRHLSEKVQEQNFYEFRRQIEYKAHGAKIPVVIADRWYPSSKTCVKCGYIKKDLKLSDRTYVCPHCGSVIDRDFQAALNLKRYGEAELSKSAS